MPRSVREARSLSRARASQSGGFAPRTPYSLTRGDPNAPLRSRGALAFSRARFSIRGLRPADPLLAHSRGPQCPAPFARRARFLARALLNPGASPRGPPTRSLAGTPMPRSVREARSLSRARASQSGGFAPRTPYSLTRGDPNAPLRSRGALAFSRARFSIRGLRPADPLLAHSRGPQCPAPFARRARFLARALLNPGASPRGPP